ncbi:Ig-like domain-containing protein, partial [Allofournierella sp.]|uniref:Ig-like domain-containing protein n=1 Tax=Allofournierella sp. TaxID=1940256 RepID=UPI002E7974D4
RSTTTVQVHTPSQAGTYLVSYTVSDGRGGSARGTLTVYVQDDAPLKAPIARDDYVAYEDLPTDGSAVRVKVLDNDEDPDGSIDELTVTTAEAGVSVSGSELLIPVTDSKRLVVYTITDRDGLTNSAVVTIPGRDSTAPFLSSANLPIEMDAGTSRTINLSDYVITRAGRTPRLVEGSSPVPQNGLDSVVADSDTQLTLTANASFSGNSAFLIQVADGDSSDAGALSASLSLPVRIKATKNQPPTFTPTAIRVEAGGEAVAYGDGGYECFFTHNAAMAWDTMTTPAYVAAARSEGDDYTVALRPGLCEGAFLPKAMAGVSATSANKDEAGQFVAVLFGDAVQSTWQQDGMPVRADALESSINACCKKDETKQNVRQIVDALKTPVTMPDETVSDALLKNATALIEGKTTLDQAQAGVEDALKLYLAEQQ